MDARHASFIDTARSAAARTDPRHAICTTHYRMHACERNDSTCDMRATCSMQRMTRDIAWSHVGLVVWNGHLKAQTRRMQPMQPQAWTWGKDIKKCWIKSGVPSKTAVTPDHKDHAACGTPCIACHITQHTLQHMPYHAPHHASYAMSRSTPSSICHTIQPTSICHAIQHTM